MNIKISDNSEDKFRLEFKKALKTINLELTSDKIEKFYLFYNRLIQINQEMNLTTIIEEKEVIYKHFVDSLSINKAISDINVEKYRIMDVGTGAGFPGIPLGIAYSQLELDLLDSLNKKIRFINTAASDFQITNVRGFHGRAEDFAHNKEFREKYDIVVSRALANLSSLSEYCIPFLKMGGKFVAYKSDKISEELETAQKAIDLLGGTIETIIDFSLEFDHIQRSFVIIKKVAPTKTKYPRKAGIVTKSPL